VRVDPPLVVVRVIVGDLKTGNDPILLRRLLELNARQLVHASYGLDGERVVLSSALELENLDFNELQATLDEIDMALAQDLPGLVKRG
jgi:Tir chaperone protein (CesT) family